MCPNPRSFPNSALSVVRALHFGTEWGVLGTALWANLDSFDRAHHVKSAPVTCHAALACICLLKRIPSELESAPMCVTPGWTHSSPSLAQLSSPGFEQRSEAHWEGLDEVRECQIYFHKARHDAIPVALSLLLDRQRSIVMNLLPCARCEYVASCGLLMHNSTVQWSHHVETEAQRD